MPAVARSPPSSWPKAGLAAIAAPVSPDEFHRRHDRGEAPGSPVWLEKRGPRARRRCSKAVLQQATPRPVPLRNPSLREPGTDLRAMLRERADLAPRRFSVALRRTVELGVKAFLRSGVSSKRRIRLRSLVRNRRTCFAGRTNGRLEAEQAEPSRPSCADESHRRPRRAAPEAAVANPLPVPRGRRARREDDPERRLSRPDRRAGAVPERPGRARGGVCGLWERATSRRGRGRRTTSFSGAPRTNDRQAALQSHDRHARGARRSCPEQGGRAPQGDIMLSVAGVDLVYVGLRVLLASVGTLDQLPASVWSAYRFCCTSNAARGGAGRPFRPSRRSPLERAGRHRRPSSGRWTPRFPTQSEEAILEHARVVDEIMRRSTTRFCRCGSDAAFADGCPRWGAARAGRRALERPLDRVRGCVELGLRVVVEEAGVAPKAESGTEYMARRLGHVQDSSASPASCMPRWPSSRGSAPGAFSPRRGCC